MKKAPVCIAVTNQKGGVAKTTTAVNLAAALGDAGAKVLLIDLDPQGHLALNVGLDVSEEVSVADWLVPDPGESFTLEDICRRDVMPSVDLLPSNLALAAAADALANQMNRETVLKRKLDAEAGAYDYIIIDNQPTLSLLVLNALAAATYYLVPFEPNIYCMQALLSLEQTIEDVKAAQLNADLRLLGIVITRLEANVRQHKDVMAMLEEERPNAMFNTKFKKAVDFDKALATSQPMYIAAPSSVHRLRFDNLAEEIEARIAAPANTTIAA